MTKKLNLIFIVALMFFCFDYISAEDVKAGAPANKPEVKKLTNPMEDPSIVPPKADDVKMVNNPKNEFISLDFPGAPLSSVLNVLSERTGRKFITDGELARKQIVLKLKNVNAQDAFNALLDTYNLYYLQQPNSDICVIKSKSEALPTVEIMPTTKVVYLNYASSKDLETVLRAKVTKNGSVSAEERTNSLIIYDIAENIERMESLIRMVDLPPMQVILEARIVDVRTDASMKIGNQIKGVKNNATLPAYNYSQVLPQGLDTSGKLNVSILSGDYNVDGFIEIMKQDTNAEVLTNPKLLVLNNQEASIDIIEQIPFSQSVIGTGSTTNSIEFKDVGIKLRVKPQINRDNTIILHVSPEQSFRSSESVLNTPVINTSKTTTTLMLKNGETAVIGGLARETDTKTEIKVPLLGDIPIIGYLFKKYSKEKIRTELTIFITANIVK